MSRDSLNFTQLWAAATAVLFGLLLVIVTRYQGRQPTKARGQKLGLGVYQEGPKGMEIIADPTALEVGSELGIRLTVRDEGHVLVYLRDDAGVRAIHPDRFGSVAVPPGLVDLRNIVELGKPTNGTLNAVFCDSAFEIDPDDPKRPWSCEAREFSYTVH